MTYPLYQLNGRLQKVVGVVTEEIDNDEGDCKGLFVFRDENGEKFMWGQTPIRYEFHNVDTVTEADQVSFLCPLCFANNKGDVGTHGVMVTFAGRNVPDCAGSRNADGKPTRWEASGTNINDLVLTPSILLNASQSPEQGCHWHGFVGSSGIPPGCAG